MACIKEYIDRIAVSEVLAEFGKKTVFAYTDLIRAVAKIPVADVVEQKHGKWIEYSEAFGFGGLQEHIVCSECLEVFYLVNNDTEKFNYCPSCGARMDGE